MCGDSISIQDQVVSGLEYKFEYKAEVVGWWWVQIVFFFKLGSYCLFKSNLVSCMFLSQASMVKLPEDEDTPEKRVNRIFNQMDTVLNIYMYFSDSYL